MAEFGDFPEELTENNDQIIKESLDVMRSVMEFGADAPRLDYPFTQIDDQAIIKAFGDEPACFRSCAGLRRLTARSDPA